MITSDELKKIRGQLSKNAQNASQVSVVKRGDLDRIRKEVIIKDKSQILAERKLLCEQKVQQMAVAMARKQRMQKQDRDRAATAPLQVEGVNKFGENTLLQGAQAQMDEGYDDVKHMNQMVLASKVCTIRDRQIEENKMLEQNWVEE